MAPLDCFLIRWRKLSGTASREGSEEHGTPENHVTGANDRGVLAFFASAIALCGVILSHLGPSCFDNKIRRVRCCRASRVNAQRARGSIKSYARVVRMIVLWFGRYVSQQPSLLRVTDAVGTAVSRLEFTTNN